MIHTANNLNGTVLQFDDAMVCSLLGPVAIAVSVVWLMDSMNDGLMVSLETYVWGNFDVFMLMGPVSFFAGMGVAMGVMSYELLGNEWIDVNIILTAAQWYWNETMMSVSHENSTLIDQWWAHLSINECWGIGGTSEDVLHSFSLKEFGFHTDCMPGKHISHTVLFLVNSVVMITCQELCGYGHAGMTLSVIMD